MALLRCSPTQKDGGCEGGGVEKDSLVGDDEASGNIPHVAYTGKNWFPLGAAGRDILRQEQGSGPMSDGSSRENGNDADGASTEHVVTTCLSMQYAFPLDRLAPALAAVSEAAVADGHAHRTLEVKFLKGSDACLLGYNCGGDVACINLWWPLPTHDGGIPAQARLRAVERAMQKAGGRPHFGKYHVCDDAYMHRVVPGMSAFREATALHLPTQGRVA